MRLYHDTTARVRPDQRPLIMANVDGIDNGIRKRPMDVAAHRFPIQWTGDIGPGFEFLRRGVENAVNSGVESVFPYQSEDLGGHVANPTTEQYLRWIEYGALSPVYRPHCTHNLERMPWTFGQEAETVARNFLNMRYRLLPVFYAGAHDNYETGEPLLRRLDLDYPLFPAAGENDQYLLGKHIFVAPVLQSSAQVAPGNWLKTPAGEPGLKGEYFTNENFSGLPALTRTDADIDFIWNTNSPAPEFPRTHFTARWTGTVEVPADIGDVTLSTMADDGVRVWIDGRLAIDAWGPHAATTTPAGIVLTAGQAHKLRIDYLQLDFDALMKLQWQAANHGSATRIAWLPPGDWINAWTGEVVAGPETVTNEMPRDQIPIYIRAGAVVPLAPSMSFTGEKPWNPVMLDLYPKIGSTNAADLYEDDTLTTAYQRGDFRTTHMTASAKDADKIVNVEIGAATGSFHRALKERVWTLRLHPPAAWSSDFKPVEVMVNHRKINIPFRRLARNESAMPFGDPMGAPDGDVFEIKLPAASVSKNQSVEIVFAPAG
jgi:hypothetical protein